MIIISTSILSATDRIESVKMLNNTDTDYIHIDVMDNKFVPNYQLPVAEVNMLGKITEKPFDIHLMMEDPQSFIENLEVSNVDSITIHLEIAKSINELLALIKSHGYKCGLAINPKTDLSLIDEYIDKVDKILIMSVEPGYGGQKFIEDTIERIALVRIKRNDVIIEVDGGINNNIIKEIANNIDIAVVGSYITSSNNYQEAINNLKI